ncbi:MAG TPA: methyltransferase domain-containing protein [Gemmatimonadales bacterium]|nr:methyltransferase domain-containing protein [Gemmatimonadales bacterium]
MTDAFRDFEHEGWERVARAYADAWPGLTAQFGERLLDDAGVGEGMRVLDVAAGPGVVTRAAARRGARATGLDFSRAMVDVARAANPGIEFREGDAQELPFAAATFERVVMNFGVLHLSDPDRAFAEGRRVLVPGGRYGFTVWAAHERNRGMGIVAEAVARYGQPATGIPPGPDRLRFAQESECRRALTAAGFDPTTFSFTTHDVRWLAPTASYLLDIQRDAAVRTAAALRQQPQDRLARIREAVEQEVASYRVADGFAVPMSAHVITAAVASR